MRRNRHIGLAAALLGAVGLRTAIAGGRGWVLISDPPPPIPLTITTSVESLVHNDDTQIVTFTFASPVGGFTAEDVTVLRGTKQGFASLSRNVYTLEVTGIGGGVEVRVAAGAAQALGGSATNSAAIIRNFYSDEIAVPFPSAAPLRFVRIPAGQFQRGSPESERSRDPWEKQHNVTLTRDYYIAKTEVSQSQWLAVMEEWPGEPPNPGNGTGPDLPAYNLSWLDAEEFCDTATSPQLRLRLPTEAEWERAARAGTQTRFHFGDSLDASDNCGLTEERRENMWFCGSTPDRVGDVSSLRPNAYGLHNVHGNVAEWVEDFFAPYSSTPLTDPVQGIGIEKTLRGGWFDSPAGAARSASRSAEPHGMRSVATGFRPALDWVVVPTVSVTPPADVFAPVTFLVEYSASVTGLTQSDVVVSNFTSVIEFTQLDSRQYRIVVGGLTTYKSFEIPEGACTPVHGETRVARAAGWYTPYTPPLSPLHGQPEAVHAAREAAGE